MLNRLTYLAEHSWDIMAARHFIYRHLVYGHLAYKHLVYGPFVYGHFVYSKYLRYSCEASDFGHKRDDTV